MPRLSVASSSKPSTNSPMMRNTRQGSVCVNSSARGLSSSCSSCVAPLSCLWRGVSFFSIDLDAHNIKTAIDVDYFAGNAGRHRATEEDCGVPDFAGVNVTAEGCSFGVVFQHRAEI